MSLTNSYLTNYGDKTEIQTDLKYGLKSSSILVFICNRTVFKGQSFKVMLNQNTNV